MSSNRCPSPVGPRQSAFTLVELLVVVGIIAVLVAMLLPALQKAQAASQATQCASNMKQIGNGIAMFANNHQGRAPGGATGKLSTGSPRTIPWAEILSAEMFTRRTPGAGYNYKNYQQIPSGGLFFAGTAKLVCPIWPYQDATNNGLYRRMYSANIWMIGGTPNFAPYMPEGPLGLIRRDEAPSPTGRTIMEESYWDEKCYVYWHGTKLSKFRNPANKYLIIETERANDVISPNNDATVFLGDDPKFPQYCAGKGTANPASTGGGLFAYRHNKQMNVLFVDGHVAGVPFETLAVNRPSVSKWYVPSP